MQNTNGGMKNEQIITDVGGNAANGRECRCNRGSRRGFHAWWWEGKLSCESKKIKNGKEGEQKSQNNDELSTRFF